jgi:hypothetical protein
MNADLLFGSTPKRLFEKDGAWILEVQRQVSVDRSVYRPELRSLSGREVILQYLRQDPQHQTLAMAALDLLRGPALENRSYEAINGEWVPSAFVNGYGKPRAARVNGGANLKLLQVQTESLRLQHKVSELTARVVHLENMLQQLLAGVPIAAQRSPVQSSIADNSEAPAASAEAAAEVAPKAPNSTRQRSPKKEKTALAMPEVDALVRCLEQLIGSDITAQAAAKPLQVQAGKSLYGAPIQNQRGEVVAAVVLDLKAAVLLGGTLLMIPQAELNQQVKAGTVSEDCLAASAELCNAFASRIGDQVETLQTEMLGPIDLEKLAWLDSASASVTLEDSVGGKLLVALK